MAMTPSTKTCSQCGQTKDLQEFPLVGVRRPGKYRAACLECKRNPGRKKFHPDWESELKRKRDQKFRQRFGMSLEERNQIVESIGSTCMACGTHELESYGNLGLDHDHSCCPTERSCGKCIRGVLCYHCNLALGYLKDDPSRIRGLLYYLEVNNFGESTRWIPEAK